MAGIMPALEAHHDIRAGGKPINNLALAFIAPLGTDHGDIGHGSNLSEAAPQRALPEAHENNAGFRAYLPPKAPQQ